MEYIKELLSKVKTVLTKINKKYSKKQVAVIAGVVVTAAVAGVALAGISSIKEKKDNQSDGLAVQEDTSDQGEDPLAEEPSLKKPTIPSGWLGVIEGVYATKASNDPYLSIGTNVEDVLVGQRIAKREGVDTFDAEEYVEASVNSIDDQSWELAENTKISDKDYKNLLAIVEAEAGGEKIKGRILVANVIFNRVESDQFPDSVTEVVWDRTGGSAQFSPTADGRIHTVTVSDVTREAVNRAIDGEDYSEGALFFLDKSSAAQHNIEWFDNNLNYLFEYGCHSFYKY